MKYRTVKNADRRWLTVRKKSGNIAEAGLSLLVFFLFIVYPLINLAFVACDLGTIALITTEAATAAAAQSNHQSALDAMQASVAKNCNLGLGKFAHLLQNGGYQNCGANLYIVETNLKTQSVAYYGPNTPYALPPDSSNCVYEYRVDSNFQVSPFINLSSVPFIGQVPLLGQPAQLKWTSDRAVEVAADGTAPSPNNAGGSSSTTGTGSGGAAGSGSGSTPGGSGTAGSQPPGCVI